MEHDREQERADQRNPGRIITTLAQRSSLVVARGIVLEFLA
jgi:hypothetical protein